MSARAPAYVHERIILRTLLLQLGLGDGEITSGPFPGMLCARGILLELAGEEGRFWIAALVPCDECRSYHESGPIATAADLDAPREVKRHHSLGTGALAGV